jgi:hypothetical protein
MAGKIGLFTAALVLSALAGLSVTGSKPTPLPRADSDTKPAGMPITPPGVVVARDWILAGNYAESCSDPPLCPGIFGAASSGGTCRKVMVFHLTRGRWHATNLTGLSAVAILESPDGAPLAPGNRPEWRQCDLIVTDEADSAQTAGLAAMLDIMLSGLGGPGFDHVSHAPITVSFAPYRVIAEVPGTLRLHLHPGNSLNKLRPPDLNNLGGTFHFLGPLYIYEADSLSWSGTDAHPGWSYTGRSAAVSQFAWNSEVASQEIGEALKP